MEESEVEQFYDRTVLTAGFSIEVFPFPLISLQCWRFFRLKMGDKWKSLGLRKIFSLMHASDWARQGEPLSNPGVS